MRCFFQEFSSALQPHGYLLLFNYMVQIWDVPTSNAKLTNEELIICQIAGYLSNLLQTLKNLFEMPQLEPQPLD